MLALTPVLAFIALVVAQADPSVSTPASLVQCQPAVITWVASHAPIELNVLPGGKVGARPLKKLGKHKGSSYTWKAVDLKGGEMVTFQVIDALGSVSYSAAVTVQEGSSSACLKHK